MSPQHSNRQALLEGALQCIEQRGYAEITTRDIARAASANVASISYHFGSKEALVAEALAEGFRRWLADLEVVGADSRPDNSIARLRAGAETLEQRLEQQRGLACAFVSALSHAVHHEELQGVLAGAFGEMRTGFAEYLGLDPEHGGELIASLIMAAFDGLLIQWLIDPAEGRKILRQLPDLLEMIPVSAPFPAPAPERGG